MDALNRLEQDLRECKQQLEQAADVDPEELKALKKSFEDKTEQLGRLSLMQQLQNTFAHLQFGVGSFYDPVKFVDACDGIIKLDHPVREQNDANDFFNKLCDQMDEALKGTESEKMFDDSFQLIIESEWSATVNGQQLTRPGPEDVALAINIEVEGQVIHTPFTIH